LVHGNVNLSRVCYTLDFGLFGEPAPCPYSDSVVIITPNSTTDSIHYNYTYGYNITLPGILVDIFSSGTSTNTTPSTVSNSFDIRWRQLNTDQDELYQNGSTFFQGTYRQIETLIEDDVVKVVEGLVVDAKSGGLGFRNHTLPSGVGYGAVWGEDLLTLYTIVLTGTEAMLS
jgi:hypothetical protein